MLFFRVILVKDLLIPGFCKNDSKHDVYLLVEAFEAKSNRRRVGEAKYGIYPRTNAPKANLYAPLGEDMYHATDYMTILRTLSTENLQMHCGRLKYTARLKRVAKPPRELGGEITPTPEPVSAEPTPRVPTFPTEIPPTPSKEDGEEVVDDSFLTPTPRQSRMSPHGEKKEFVHDELNIPDSPETLDGDIPSKKVGIKHLLYFHSFLISDLCCWKLGSRISLKLQEGPDRQYAETASCVISSRQGDHLSDVTCSWQPSCASRWHSSNSFLYMVRGNSRILHL